MQGPLPRANLAVASALSLMACRSADSLERPRIDHIMLIAADLIPATEAFAKATGVRPVYGGKHPTGTHNALASLGSETYIEVISPQPGVVPPPDYPDLSQYHEPRPWGWAVSAGDGTALRQALERVGFHLTAAVPGSRTTAAGTTLRWHLFNLDPEFEEAPFFIIWDPGTPHPAATSPSGCSLEELSVAGPHAVAVSKLVHTLGLNVHVIAAEKPALAVRLKCPTGSVVFK